MYLDPMHVSLKVAARHCVVAQWCAQSDSCCPVLRHYVKIYNVSERSGQAFNSSSKAGEGRHRNYVDDPVHSLALLNHLSRHRHERRYAIISNTKRCCTSVRTSFADQQYRCHLSLGAHCNILVFAFRLVPRPAAAVNGFDGTFDADDIATGMSSILS